VSKTLIEWIKYHEGFRAFPYKCPAGFLTIGIGRNIEQNGISMEEAEYLLRNDLDRCQKELYRFSWYSEQPRAIREALVNMCFNLGLPRLLGFKRMIAALERKDYTQAAIEALDSNWAAQVGQRAKDIALMIREGGNAPRC